MNPHINKIKPPTTAKNAYDSIFVDQLNPSCEAPRKPARLIADVG